MIKGKLNNIEFEFVDRWSELTLSLFIKIANIEVPPKLMAMEIANIRIVSAVTKKEKEKAEKELTEAENAILEDDIIKHFPIYYGKLLEVLIDNKEAVDMINWKDRTSIYEFNIKQFVLSMILENPVQSLNNKLVPYSPKEIEFFNVGKEKFYMPESVRLFGEIVPMGNEPIISFSESVDMDLARQGLIDGGINKLAFFMAVYCRKKGEKYNQQNTIARQDLFNDLTMDVVWSVFFYIAKLTSESMKTLAYFSKVLELEERTKLVRQAKAQKCET
jgi:hypothetical protein